jgi:hypothetical protein
VSAQTDADWELPRAIAAHVDPAYRNFAGPGWRSILENLHDRLVVIDPNYRLDQVNEKMGVLRIYATDRCAAIELAEYVARNDIP